MRIVKDIYGSNIKVRGRFKDLTGKRIGCMKILGLKEYKDKGYSIWKCRLPKGDFMFSSRKLCEFKYNKDTKQYRELKYMIPLSKLPKGGKTLRYERKVRGTSEYIREEYPNYRIFDDGKVYSIKKQKFIPFYPIYIDNRIYHRFVLTDKDFIRKGVLLHVAVMVTHGPARPSSQHEVDHKKHRKHNNDALINLQWATHSENNLNRRVRKRKTTFYGVYFDRDTFKIIIPINNFLLHRTFKSKVKAARFYDKIVVYLGIDRTLNFPKSYPNYQWRLLDSEITEEMIRDVKYNCDCDRKYGVNKKGCVRVTHNGETILLDTVANKEEGHRAYDSFVMHHKLDIWLNYGEDKEKTLDMFRDAWWTKVKLNEIVAGKRRRYVESII